MIIAAVSKFGEIKSIKIQLIGMWQKAVVKFAELDQANLLASKWLFLIGKDSVHIAKAVGDCKTWALRDQFRALLFTLLVKITVHDLETFLERTGGKTCIINKSLKTGKKICCAVVGFEFDDNPESVFRMELILGGIKLFWARMDLFGHFALKCDAPVASPSKPSRTFKRVVSNEHCLQLAKLYEKKSVPIFCPAAFGSKSWAQVVLFAGSSDGFHFVFGFGSPFSGTLGLNDSLSFVLQHKISATSFSSLLKVSATLIATKENLVLDMVMNDSELVLLLPSSTFPSVSTLGLSSSKVLTTKVGSLKSKLVALKTSVSSVLANGFIWKIAMCNVQSINVPIVDKFEDVYVFTFGLNSEYLDAGVVAVMDSSLAKHVCKVFEMPGQLLSIRLLFKNKLSVSVLGLYAGALSAAQFSQAGEINSLIAKAANGSSFIILNSNFNKDSLRRSASFKKCVSLGLVNSLNSRGVEKTIDFVLVLLNLVSAIVNCNVMDVCDYFDTNHQAVSVSVDLGSLLNTQLNFLCRQANKDHWKFDFKGADNAKWDEFKEAMAANAAMLSDINKIFRKKWSKDYNGVFTKESSKFHKLELLVTKIAKIFHKKDVNKFVLLMEHWDSLNNIKALIVQKIVNSGADFDCVHSALFNVQKTYHVSKLVKSLRAEES
ncbi:hypothetical protein G9A89_014665 [Geosiphon pyriformis]|nr:hypothetical protein G9A89_014665 [Geosiphon pyriformis]